MSTLLPKLRLRIFVRLTLIYFAIALAGLVVFKWLVPEYYFKAYPLIGLFFWVLGMFLNFSLDRTRFSTPNRLAYVFMTFRIFKLVSTIVVIAISGYLAEHYRTTIVLSVVVNYFVYMLLELYIFYMYNKRVSIRNAAAKKK